MEGTEGRAKQTDLTESPSRGHGPEVRTSVKRDLFHGKRGLVHGKRGLVHNLKRPLTDTRILE